jgi:signal transduction histidine kinase
MNLSARAATLLGSRPNPGSSLSRWERLLLAVDGAIDVDRAGGEARARRRSTRDWVVDLSMFGFAALAATAVATNAHGHIGPTLFALNAVLAVPACLVLWERRRYPMPVAWLAVALMALSSAAVHAGQVAIFSTAIHARPRRAVEATLGAIAATAVNCAIYPAPNGPSGFSRELFVSWSAMTIAAFALGSFIRVRRQLVARLRAEQELRVRDAQLVERARIAREMHDVLAHRISLLSIHAGALEVRPDASPEEIAEAASVIRTSARAAQEELREVVGVLRADPEGESVRPPQPTIADLDELIEESRHAGPEVTLVDRLDGAGPPTAVGRTVFRVVQEGLTNARKHAPAQPVSVSIAGEPAATIEVEVVNIPTPGERDGRRGEAAEHVGSGTGLIGLAERLALAGGALEHGALPGGGFRLQARIPWPAAPEDQGDAGGEGA